MSTAEQKHNVEVVECEEKPAMTVEEAEAAEDSKYSNQRFSDMYYPQYYDVYRPDPKVYNTKKIVRGPRECEGCKKKSKESLRYEPGDHYYCVDCLKSRGVCVLAGSKQLPQEIVMNITLYLDDYRDLCSFARVNWTWFSAVNYDHEAENDITRIKRYLIGREIAVQYEAHSHQNPKVTDFVNRFEIGRIIGEWTEADLKRKLALCRHTHDCAYYSKPLNLNVSSSELGAYDEENQSFKVDKELVVMGPKHHPEGHFSIHTKTKDNKPLVLIMDVNTGVVLHYHSDGGKDKDTKCDIM